MLLSISLLGGHMELFEYTDEFGNKEIRNKQGDVISKEVIDEFITSCEQIEKYRCT